MTNFLLRLVLGCFWVAMLLLNSAIAGSFTTKKSGRADALRVTYTPDPDCTLSCTEMLITVTTVAGQPSSGDRELEFVLYTASYSGQSTAYATKIILPEGATSATAKITYRQALQYGYTAVDFREDGRSLMQPRLPLSVSNTGSNVQQDILEIRPDNNAVKGSFTADFGLAGQTSQSLALSKSPSDWRPYLAYDAVIIGAPLLELASPQQVQALSTYVLAGGSVIVHSANSETAARLDQLILGSKASSNDNRWEVLSSPDRKFGAMRLHCGGRFIVFENVPPNWLEHVRSTAHYPMGDVAASGDTDKQWFWRNIVQTVGKTPVWAFIGFVMLFVIGVGPVLLRVTSRLQHRTLLLFLIPAFSLLATFLFLLFNISREGFGTRGRIAAIQYFDATSEQGFIWSRQSYFSGAPPRDGLRFSPQAMIKPILEDQLSNGPWSDPRDRLGATMEQSDDAVILSNWLSPRAQHHLLAGEPTKQFKLPIAIKKISDEQVEVSNLTERAIPIVALKGVTDGMGFLAIDLDPGETRALSLESFGKIEIQIRGRDNQHSPKMPIEIEGKSISYGYGRNYYYYNSNIVVNDPIDGALKKFSMSILPQYGVWIVSHELPQMQLPFEDKAYAKEKHYLIQTGVYPW